MPTSKRLLFYLVIFNFFTHFITSELPLRRKRPGGREGEATASNCSEKKTTEGNQEEEAKVCKSFDRSLVKHIGAASQRH